MKLVLAFDLQAFRDVNTTSVVKYYFRSDQPVKDASLVLMQPRDGLSLFTPCGDMGMDDAVWRGPTGSVRRDDRPPTTRMFI